MQQIFLGADMPLPMQSLTPVTTRSLAHAQVLWLADGAISEADALAHAVCVPDPDAPAGSLREGDMTAYADRYGGPGVGHSGGSGRCAVLNGIQVKGVGRTPLVTSKVDAFHSNGMLGFEEAMREAIWSEVAQLALPIGSVRTLALIDTGSTFQVTAADGAPEILQRFLLLRQFALRPAHYFRNVNFATPLHADTGLREDAVRTSLAVQTLPQVYRHLFPACAGAHDTVGVLNIGLLEVATRFAFQNATAMVKRIFHGSLSPSNIAMDGRYIDFGTITPVATFRRRAIRPLGTDASDEKTMLLNAVLELRFFIAKYTKLPADAKLIGQEELAAGYDSAYKRAQQLEFLKLAGVCESTVMNFPPEKAERFRQCAVAITLHRNMPFLTWAGAWGPQEPRIRRGTFDIGYLLTTLALSYDLARIRTKIEQEIGELSMAAEFADLYADLRILYLAQAPAGADARQRTLELALNALRRNADLNFLEDHPLSVAIDALSQARSGIGSYVGTTLEHAAEILSDKYDTPGLIRDALAESGPRPSAASILGKLLPRTRETFSAEIIGEWETMWNTVH